MQVPCADRASTHPLVAFTVPASLYASEGVIGTIRSRSGCLFVRVWLSHEARWVLSAGLASWTAHMDAALQRMPLGVWGDRTLTITHQTGGSMGVRL